MENWDKILEIIKKWQYAVVKKTKWKYRIFSRITWHSSIQYSDYCDNIKDCLSELSWGELFKRNIDKMDISSIEPYSIPIEYYKVSDKVMVLESAKNHPRYDEWDSIKKSMVGKWPFEIDWIWIDWWYILCHPNYDSIFPFFEHHMLTPYIED